MEANTIHVCYDHNQFREPGGQWQQSESIPATDNFDNVDFIEDTCEQCSLD